MDEELKQVIKKIVLKEYVDVSLEPFYKKIDKVSNETGKQKLLYQWVKTGHVDFKTYLKLTEYISKDIQL